MATAVATPRSGQSCPQGKEGPAAGIGALMHRCNKIAEAEAAVSVNEKKWLVMHMHVSDASCIRLQY
jgi:hypothetical protein